MIETTNPDGSLNANGYAIHLAFDLQDGGFDNVNTNPIDAALNFAAFIARASDHGYLPADHPTVLEAIDLDENGFDNTHLNPIDAALDFADYITDFLSTPAT